MRILQLSNRIPYPLNDGGNLAVHFYLEGFLNAGIQLSLLSMNTTRHWVDPENFPPIFKRLEYLETVKVDNSIQATAAFFNLFSNKSYHVERFITNEFKAALINILSRTQFDIVQLEGLYLAPYIPVIRSYSKAKIVLRQHNAEFTIWQRLAAQESSFIKKLYLKLLTKRLKAFETAVLNKVDLLLPISKSDAAIFKSLGCKIPLYIQSYGINLAKITASPGCQRPISIYHLGAMDWLPNQEAIRYFIQEVFPIIEAAHPEICFHIGGRNMPEDFFHYRSKNILVYGEVQDADAFERDKCILVAPLLSGGGVRIKIFRAMAMGKAVVATPIGMEGIEITNGKEAFLAQNAREMADQILFLIEHPEKIEDMGNAARSFICRNFEQGKMVKDLLGVYEDLTKSREIVS